LLIKKEIKIMRPVNKTRRLIISFVLFLLIIVIGFITFNQPIVEFNTSPQVAMQNMIDNDHTINSDALIMENKGGNTPILIDLRNPYDFAKFHLDNAINISSHNLLSKKFVNELEDWNEEGKNVVIMGKKLSDINGLVLLLRQLGFSNVFALQNASESEAGDNGSQMSPVDPEKQLYDYAALLADKSTFGLKEAFEETRKTIRIKPSRQSQPKVTNTPAKPPKKVVVPKPVIVEEEEEDEGGC
jgi:rhodanese-related sulfurtransferase